MEEADDNQDGGWVSVSSGTRSLGYTRTKVRKTERYMKFVFFFKFIIIYFIFLER